MSLDIEVCISLSGPANFRFSATNHSRTANTITTPNTGPAQFVHIRVRGKLVANAIERSSRLA